MVPGDPMDAGVPRQGGVEASPGRFAKASIAVALTLLASAALFALDPSLDVTQYVQQVWTTQEGLPQNTVSALLQTPDGYLWFGTEEGLVRFDGGSFTVFDKSNVRALRDNAVACLWSDPSGALWIGTWGGDLLRMVDGVFEDMTGGTGPLRGGVWSIQGTPDGDHWAATSLGLLRFHEGTRTLLKAKDGLPNDDLRALCADGSGGLWIGTRSAGLVRMRGGRFETPAGTEALGGEGVWSLLVARDGALWVGTGSGLVKLSGGRAVRFGRAEGLPEGGVRSLCEDRDGNLWVGTYGGGLCRMRGGRVDTLSAKNGFPDDAVNALLEDREGSLWAGTWGNGLVRLSRGKFLTYTAREGLAGNVMRSVCQDASGAMWIGMSGSGLSRFDGRGFTTFRKGGGLSGNSLRALLTARDGSLWVGTEAGGLDRYSKGRWKHLGAPEGLAGDFVACLLETRDGTLWAGTYGGGLARGRDGRFKMLTTRDGLPNNEVWCLHEDRAGRLWAGTTGGLAVLEGGTVRTYTAADGLASEVVVSAYESGTGSLWFGTSGGGLVRFKDGKLKACTRRDGLHDDVVFQILPDGLGNLWMSCNKGLFRVPLAALEDFADGKRATVSCDAFGKADGMGSSECMGGCQPAGCVARDGRLWFPTANGLVVVDPSHLPSNAVPPPLALEAFMADGKPLLEREEVVVPAGAHNLEIRYAALSFRAPERVLFRYRLTGFDDRWVEAGNRRVAYYTNVPPGRYRFEMTACNEDGVWNRAPKSLPVRARPRFYQTSVFLAACAVLALAASMGGYRLRVRQLRLREKRLLALVAERTSQLNEANSALEDANLRLTELSHRDPLTGVANRRRFEDVLEMEWRRTFRSGAPLAVLMADVDSFKLYNDTHGHPEGDACLRSVAAAFQSCLKRASDLLARYGGEEFIVLLPDTTLERAAALAEDLRATVQALAVPHPGAPAAPVVTVSLGVAACRPSEGGASAELVAAADRALYLAKERGRNRVERA
jgi:diguanylate cyclase (GGDEF)-like protein